MARTAERPEDGAEDECELLRKEECPAVSWVIQQLREAFPLGDALPFLVYDRDWIFLAEFTDTIRRP